MKRRLALLVGLLALLTLAVSHLLARHSDTGQGGPPVPRAPFERVWTDRPVRLVALGDSVTAGFGARPGYSYVDRLLANPADEFEALRGINLRRVLPGLTATNLAVNGSTSDQHEARIERLDRADGSVFGLVLLTTGGNDLIHNYGRAAPCSTGIFGATLAQARPWIEAFEQRLDRMFSALESRFPGGCHIFIATIYDPTDGVGDIEVAGLPPWPDGLQILAAFNEAIVRAASRHPSAHVVDVRREFLGHGFHHGLAAHWYHANVEDPNERGYDAIRRLMLIEMAKVFTGSPPAPPGR
jgi:lysophospholipase L1-like esterase